MERYNKMDFLETISSAVTAILAHKMRSFLTVLGIVIGVTSVILLISLVSGLKTYITSQIQGLGANLLFVIPGRIGGARTPGGVQANRLVYTDVTTLRKNLASQAELSGVIQRNATLKYGNKSDKGASVYGVEANYPKIISIEVTDGRFFKESELRSNRKVAVIGLTVKETLFGAGKFLRQKIDIAGQKYTVLGVLAERGSTFGIDQDNSVYIPFSTAQRQFGIDRLNAIYISVNNSSQLESVQENAIRMLRKRLSEDEFTIQSQEQTLSIVSQISSVLTAALGGIAAISLIVGGIGIMNIMLVSVTERTREIGLRKAVGGKPKNIRSQFLIEAVVLSGVGGVIGIILGIALSLVIGIFFTTTVPWWSILLSFGFSMVVGVIFGVAPAIRASRLDPIQALRYE